uniref:ATP synthase F0 subunit 8 n=1 Tax=Scelimena melli TaxID=215044 RepID=A0A7T0II74_9ORTH|nr:ATP synthase F0 subunit 8 [Scelimena melli]
MPQMSNLWWLPLAMYFSITLLIMNTMIFSASPIMLSQKNLNIKKTSPLNWKW